jgi:DNA adenine methylase
MITSMMFLLEVGSVAIAVAKKYPDVNIYMNDLNENIFCFWKIISENKPEEIFQLKSLIEKIPTIELFIYNKNTKPITNIEKAYYAIFFNRCTFSGIETAGPIGGLKQESKWKVNCRYNLKKIHKSIDDLVKLFSGRLTCTNYDFSLFLEKYNNGMFYLDPPYYKQGKNLYSCFMKPEEHLLLKNKLSSINNWLLSYDNCEEVRFMYPDQNIEYIDAKYCIDGIKENWKMCKEILVKNN